MPAPVEIEPLRPGIGAIVHGVRTSGDVPWRLEPSLGSRGDRSR